MNILNARVNILFWLSFLCKDLYNKDVLLLVDDKTKVLSILTTDTLKRPLYTLDFTKYLYDKKDNSYYFYWTKWEVITVTILQQYLGGVLQWKVWSWILESVKEKDYEDYVIKHYQHQGYELVWRQFRLDNQNIIDVILRKNGIIYIVELKKVAWTLDHTTQLERYIEWYKRFIWEKVDFWWKSNIMGLLLTTELSTQMRNYWKTLVNKWIYLTTYKEQWIVN